MSKRTKPRLGKGLSGLIGQPVPIDAPPVPDTPDQVNDADTIGGSSGVPRPQKPIEVSVGAGSLSQQGSGESVSLPDGRRMRVVDVAAIEPNRYQPRRAFDTTALDTLAESIRRAGVIQPIAVRTAQGDSGKAWELVAGERRWRAAQRAGLKKIPAIVVDLSERESAEWALVENLQREDLNPIERADALRRLADQFGLTHQEISEQVGLERATVTNHIRMTELEPEIRLLITAREGDRLTGGHGKALLGVEAGADRIALARAAAREGWSVRQLEREIASAKSHEPSKGAGDPSSDGGSGGGGGETPTHPAIASIERQLSEHLNTRVRIEANKERTKGRVVISFYDLAHFDALCEQMRLPVSSL